MICVRVVPPNRGMRSAEAGCWRRGAPAPTAIAIHIAKLCRSSQRAPLFRAPPSSLLAALIAASNPTQGRRVSPDGRGFVSKVSPSFR